MDAIRDVLHLGGYGLFVWPAYGAAIAILGWMTISTLRRLRTTERALESLQDIRNRSAGNVSATESDGGNGGAGVAGS